MNPANPVLGQREIIRLMDAGASLSRHFDMDLASLLPAACPTKAFVNERRTLTAAEA